MKSEDTINERHKYHQNTSTQCDYMTVTTLNKARRNLLIATVLVFGWTKILCYYYMKNSINNARKLISETCIFASSQDRIVLRTRLQFLIARDLLYCYPMFVMSALK